MSKQLEKARQKLWTKVYVAKIKKLLSADSAERAANQAVKDFNYAFKEYEQN